MKIEIDYVCDDINGPLNDYVAKVCMDKFIDENELDVTFELVTLNGPSGHPVFYIHGEKEDLEEFVDVYTNKTDSFDTFLI